MTNIKPVILCGGSGTRLWPLSRSLIPKQLLALTGDRSLLQETWLRAQRVVPAQASPLVICNEAHRFMVQAQLLEAGADPRLIVEPAGRNTAPAVAVAALAVVREQDEDVLLLVLPSDHVIKDVVRFVEAVRTGVSAARRGDLVTFGVAPGWPDTGYGYIRASDGGGEQPIEEFVEKPDLETARHYVASGRYFWNSGMFLFTAGSYLRELKAQAPDILAACEEAIGRSRTENGVIQPEREAFLGVRSLSVDHAVMEATVRGVVVPMDAGWNDVGTWGALLDALPSDERRNAISGDVLAIDCKDSLIRAESRLIAAVGLDGCIVVETKDAVLVAPASRAQDVRALVDELNARQRPEAVHGREVFRPWGSYDSLESRPGFQVKRLAVLPGAVLSLQLHHRRAEHWVVVSGCARITRGDDTFDLKRNEHTFIPLGVRHRIENPGTDLLQIIEVQIGDYLGEDDIVRLEDRYGRQGRTD